MIQSLNIFTNKKPFRKANSEFYRNHILTLQIRKSKSRPYVSKELAYKHIRCLLIPEILLFINFVCPEKLAFHEHLFSQIRQKYLFR